MDQGNELPRIPFLRTPVNKGKRKGRVPPYRAHPSPTALATSRLFAREIERFAPNYCSEQPESIRLPSMPLAAARRWSRCR